VADPSETTQVSREPAVDDAGDVVGAVRALTAEVGALQSEVTALRHEARILPSDDGERPGWDDGRPIVRESPHWIRSVDSPSSRRVAVPWLLLEILFIVAVAVLAAVAGLDAPVIAGVMVGAWLLVALVEWATARSQVREQALIYGSTVVQAGSPDDPRWLGAAGSDTALDLAADDRATTRLPPPQPE
jgi:hypothetical protein